MSYCGGSLFSKTLRIIYTDNRSKQAGHATQWLINNPRIFSSNFALTYFLSFRSKKKCTQIPGFAKFHIDFELCRNKDKANHELYQIFFLSFREARLEI
jgi:hypothetical protein